MTSSGTSRPAFLQLLARARRRLVLVALAEGALASGIGASLGLGLALTLVGWLPFSLELRAALWGLIALMGLVAALISAWQRLRPLRAPARIARLLEEAALRRGHALRDDVRSAVDLLDEGQDLALGRSRALCDAHIDQVAERLARAGALSSIEGVALGLALPTLLLAMGVCLIAGMVAVLFPAELRVRTARLFDEQAASLALQAVADARLPLVTDLEVTLRFPAYMAREDQVVIGTTGDIVAPRGTEVFLRGRADRTILGASLWLGEREVALLVEGDRQVSGRFTVTATESYRFRLTEPDGDLETDPVMHLITLVPDAAPEVQLQEPAEDRVVQADEEVALAFSATDDYGLSRIRLIVRRQAAGREPYEEDLLVLPQALARTSGRGAFSVRDLGARPGERLSVFIEAFDNDTVGGPKAGRSQTRVLTVFSAAAHHRELIELEQKLLDRMVQSLGDELETPVDRAWAGLDAEGQLRALAPQLPMAERASGLLQALGQVLAHLATDPLSPDAVRRAIANMRSDLERPLRQRSEVLQSAHKTLLARQGVLAHVYRTLAAQQKGLVERLEQHILYLEDLLHTQRIDEARQIADDLKSTQKELSDLLEEYRKAPSDALRSSLMEEIARLRQQMQELMQRLAELDRDVPDEYMNQEAFESREMMDRAQDLDRLIEEGKLEEAAAMLQQMVEQTQKLTEQLDESADEYGGEEMRALREKLERFGEELSALSARQEELLQRNERRLEQARASAEKRLAGKLEQMLKALREKASAAQDTLKPVDAGTLYALEQEDVAMAQARTEELQAALSQGDIEDALEAAAEARAAAQRVERALTERTRGRYGDRSPGTQDARDRFQKARPMLDELYDELSELMPDPAQELSPAQRQALRQDAEAQRELKDAAGRVSRQMAEIGKELPIFGPGHQQQLQEAGERMSGAGRALTKEDLRGARSGQQQALQNLRDLQRSLEEMGQGSPGGGGLPLPLPGGGAPGSERSGQGRPGSHDKVKIPGADEFRVPDAFRKDILDAMREGVPQPWEGEVKRYYEELVK